VKHYLGLSALALALASCATPQGGTQPEIAITVDDLPVHAPYPPGVTPDQVTAQMIAALTAARVPGVREVVEELEVAGL
jgi:hypothetical protein